MKKKTVTLLFLILLLSSCRTKGTPGPDTVIIWLQNNVVPFHMEPGHGCEELRPLLDVIGDARIVALGESAHGTHEFITIQHHIIECLVAEKGFNTIAMEADGVWANKINTYVRTEGGKVPLVWNTRNLINTDETLLLINWIREYNLSRENSRRISFRGFDIGSGQDAYWEFKKYIESVEPNSTDEIMENLSCFKTYVMPANNQYDTQNAEIQDQCRKGLQVVYAHMLANQTNYASASSTSAYTDALQNIRTLIQYERLVAFKNSNSPEARGLRDRYMAENVQWLMEQAGQNSKFILIAHNSHIQKTPVISYGTVTKVPEAYWEFVAQPTMGMYLYAAYDDDMVSVGSSFHHGQYNAASFKGNNYGRVKAQTASTLPENSHEEYLLGVGTPCYILDLRSTRTASSVISSWFEKPRWLRNHGVYHDPDDPSFNFQWVVLPQAFDIFIFLEETTPSHLRWR